jgi:hypothetical protein
MELSKDQIPFPNHIKHPRNNGKKEGGTNTYLGPYNGEYGCGQHVSNSN